MFLSTRAFGEGLGEMGELDTHRTSRKRKGLVWVCMLAITLAKLCGLGQTPNLPCFQESLCSGAKNMSH